MSAVPEPEGEREAGRCCESAPAWAAVSCSRVGAAWMTSLLEAAALSPGSPDVDGEVGELEDGDTPTCTCAIQASGSATTHTRLWSQLKPMLFGPRCDHLYTPAAKPVGTMQTQLPQGTRHRWKENTTSQGTRQITTPGRWKGVVRD